MCLRDRGASAVAQALVFPWNTNLRELCLGCNQIGDAGACSIASALASGACVRRLSLRDNHIGDVGALALAEALSRNSMIEELDLWGNRLSAVGKAAIDSAARCEVFLEFDFPPEPAIPASGPVSTAMRGILFDWILQVHSGVQMPEAAAKAPDSQDVLFRTYGHLDAFVATRAVPGSHMQLAGVACTLLASGYGVRQWMEDDAQLASWLAFVTDGTCTVPEVRLMLSEVQTALGFRLRQPTVYTFLRRFLRRTGWTEKSFSLANYLIELAVMDPAFRVYRPQAVAAAATILCRQYCARGVAVKQSACWKSRLLRGAHVNLHSELAPCTADLAQLHVVQQRLQGKFVNRKYSWARLHMVAKIPPNTPGNAAYFSEYMSN